MFGRCRKDDREVFAKVIEKAIEKATDKMIETVLVNAVPRLVGDQSCRSSSTSGSRLPDIREGG
jgi:hypothetical protein